MGIATPAPTETRTVSPTIDGRAIAVPERTTIWEAARGRRPPAPGGDVLAQGKGAGDFCAKVVELEETLRMTPICGLGPGA